MKFIVLILAISITASIYSIAIDLNEMNHYFKEAARIYSLTYNNGRSCEFK
jgi:hypothetical protein